MKHYIFALITAALCFVSALPSHAQAPTEFGKKNQDMPGFWPRPTDERILQILSDVVTDYPDNVASALKSLRDLETDPVIGKDAVLLSAIMTNTGEEESYKPAVDLLNQCVKRYPEHSGCYVWLGNYTQYGVGVEKNYKTAADYFEIAANLGSAPGQWYYGMAYLRGQGRAQDSAAAFMWIEKSARQDYPSGLNSYMVMKKMGDGTAKDDRAAFLATARLAHFGDVNSFVLLGDMFSKGQGHRKDLYLADAATVRAASLGHLRSQQRLQKHFEGMSGRDAANFLADVKKTDPRLDQILQDAKLPE